MSERKETSRTVKFHNGVLIFRIYYNDNSCGAEYINIEKAFNLLPLEHKKDLRDFICPPADWQKRTCGECGYWWYTTKDTETESLLLDECGCVLHGHDFPCDYHTPARPCFIARPKPEDTK